MTQHFNKQSVRRLGVSVLFCAILLGVLMYTSAVLKPTRSLLTSEAGSAWDGFLKQPGNSLDVVFFGNSHVFDGVDPSVIWKTEGVTSYVMAGPVQPLKIGRHYVAEVLRTQKPKVIAFDMSILTYNDRNYVREFQLINVGYMPWGENRLKAVFVDTPKDDRTSALVDLVAYHSSWSQLKPADLKVWSRDPGDKFLKGFQVVSTSKPVTDTADPNRKPEKPSILAAEKANAELIREIARLCKASDIELLLFLTPTGPPNGFTPALKRAEAELNGEFDNVTFLDLSEPGAVPGLSYKTDFFDGGHLSTPGAEKSSAVLASFLSKRYGLQSHRGDPAFSEWDTDVAEHDAYVKKVWGDRYPK